MFTGIVEELGTVEAISDLSLRVTAEKVNQGLSVGDSVAVNGACLTVTSFTTSAFTVEVMPETLRRSNIGGLSRGDRVNLERALTLATRIGGHLVQGHVDATGEVVSLRPDRNAMLLEVSAPESVTRFLVEKSFIAVDGISLTVASCRGPAFIVSVVGFTRNNTTVGLTKRGKQVNLEVDIVAKYVEHFTKTKGSGVNMELLAKYGYNMPSAGQA